MLGSIEINSIKFIFYVFQYCLKKRNKKQIRNQKSFFNAHQLCAGQKWMILNMYENIVIFDSQMCNWDPSKLASPLSV